MKKCMVLLVVLSLVAMAGTALADDGIYLEVFNKTGKSLSAKVIVKSFDHSKEFHRTVAKDGAIQFTKAETKHRDGKIAMGWQVIFHDSCKYLITGKDDDCSVQVGTSSCAEVTDVGGKCSFRFTVAE